jgi:hypothetical protein
MPVWFIGVVFGIHLFAKHPQAISLRVFWLGLFGHLLTTARVSIRRIIPLKIKP